MYFVSMFTAIVFVMCLSKMLYELVETVINEDNKLKAAQVYLKNNELTLLSIAVSGVMCLGSLAFMANKQGVTIIDVLIR